MPGTQQQRRVFAEQGGPPAGNKPGNTGRKRPPEEPGLSPTDRRDYGEEMGSTGTPEAGGGPLMTLTRHHYRLAWGGGKLRGRRPGSEGRAYAGEGWCPLGASNGRQGPVPVRSTWGVRMQGKRSPPGGPWEIPRFQAGF